LHAVFVFGLVGALVVDVEDAVAVAIGAARTTVGGLRRLAVFFLGGAAVDRIRVTVAVGVAVVEVDVRRRRARAGPAICS